MPDNTFTRPDSWPAGLIGEWLLQCPACDSSDDVTVETSVYVRISEDGSEPVDNVHEYDDTSPAQCTNCGHREDFGGFRAFPSALETAGPVWFEWTAADGGLGS
ncbi:hypothetical protein, partial [Gordonia alkanivorans]|uniref:hypothetical protein n=1 Tax=Gordonia alkanivorans TaxID=84096 RepID=UPI0018CC156A